MEALRYVRNCVGAVLACVALLALGGAPAHAADLGAPYATVTVSCPAGGSSGDVFAAPVDEEHPTAIARVTNVTGSGYVVVGHGASRT